MYYKSKKKKSTKKPELSPERIAKMKKLNDRAMNRHAKKKHKPMPEDEYNWCVDSLHAFARLSREGKPRDDDTLLKYMQESRDHRLALAKASCLKRDKKKAKALKKKISSY